MVRMPQKVIRALASSLVDVCSNSTLDPDYFGEVFQSLV